MKEFTCDLLIDKSAKLREFLIRNNIHFNISVTGRVYHFEIMASDRQAETINAFINTTVYNK